jgi:MFS family permease
MGGVAAVATNRRVLLLCVMNIGVMAIVSGLLAWTPSFLQDQRGASVAVAAYLTAGIGLAQLIGNPVGAASMARWGKPFVLLVSLAVMFVVTALVPAGPGLVLPFVCVTIGGFMTMAIFPAVFGSVPDIVARPEQIGVATGFVNLTNLMGTLFAPWLFGVLLDTYGKGTGSHGYLWGYMLLALFPLLGTIAAVLYAASAKKRASAPVPAN